MDESYEEILSSLTPAQAEGLLERLAGVFMSASGSTGALDRGEPADRPDREAIYPILVEQIPAVMFISFLDGGFSEAYVSPHIEKLLGFSQSEWLEDPVRWYRQLHPEDRTRWSREAAAMLLTGEAVSSVYRVISRDGRVISLRCEAKMVRHEDGRPWFIHGVAFDITDLVEAKEALARARDESEARSRQLQALAGELVNVEQRERRRLANILHDDLQQILVAAKTRLDLARRRVSNEELELSVESVLELVHKAIESCRSLTGELSPPVLHEVGLEAALEWLARWYWENHRFTAELEVDPRAEVLEERVRVFVFNAVRELLFNVIKHGDVDRASVRVAREEESLRVRVTDDGRGFDPIVLQRPGEREGFGLLSLRERLDLIGGRLEIESAPGRGTRIEITLPVEAAGTAVSVPDAASPVDAEAALEAASAPDAAAGPSEDAARAPSGTGERAGVIRVMIADDHEVVCEGLTMLLDSYSEIEIVGTARNGRIAIELARELRPDVVLMDVTMPVLDGIEATRILSTELPQTRILGFSVHEEADASAAMRAAGAADYLSKAAPPEVLLTAIRASRRAPSEAS